MNTLLDFANQVTESNVQFYCHHTRELKQSQSVKALRFIQHGCIQYMKDVPAELAQLFPTARNVFVCLPLNTAPSWNVCGIEFGKLPFRKDYNTRAYFIFKNPSYAAPTFECNCQGWQTRLKRGSIVEGGANCSHVLALYMAFKLRMFGNAEEASP